MASYYRTASATPLDYMYKVNTPLMERVIEANDRYITENLQTAQAIGNAASTFPYLQDDEGRVRDIVKGYTDKVNGITEAIRNDPANWRKQMSPIKDLTNVLKNDMFSGEISKISANYNKYKEVSDYIDKQVEEFNKSGKGISADRARAYKEYFLGQFSNKGKGKGTAYNPQTGEYNVMSAFNPMSNIDVHKLLSDELNKIKSDSRLYKKSETGGNDWYFNDVTQKWEGVTPEKILSIVTDRLNNPQLMQYLKQDSQAGLINGAFDDEGHFIAPYSYTDVPATAEEKAQISKVREIIAKTKNPTQKNQLQTQLAQYEQGIKDRTQLMWNNNSYLAPIIRGIVNEFSYSKTEDMNTLRNNSRGQIIYTQAQMNARDAANRRSRELIAREREAGVQKRHDELMDFRKKQAESKIAGGNKTTTTTKAGEIATTEAPDENEISKFNTNSFESWNTTDAFGLPVKVLSNSGLSNDIEKYKKQEAETISSIDVLSKQMKSILGNRKESDLNPIETVLYNRVRVQKERLQENLPVIQSTLNQRRQWYKGSVEAALTNNPFAKKGGVDLTPEQIAIYKAGRNHPIANSSVYKDVIHSKDPMQKAVNENAILSAHNKKYDEVKAIVDKRRENFLATMRYSPIETDAVTLSKKDSKLFGDVLFTGANPEELKIFNTDGSKANIKLEGKGISWFNPKGDNYEMSTENNSLMNYIKKNGVTYEVQQVGNTTKIGSGNAVAKVMFKDPTGQIPTTPFYVELTPELQKKYATKLSLDKKPEVAAVGNAMLDDEANYLRKQLITPTMQRSAGEEDDFDPATFTIFINDGNKKIPLQVTKFASSDGTDHLNITGSVNGQQIPLPNTASGVPGWFNGAEDFIQYIKKQRQQ